MKKFLNGAVQKEIWRLAWPTVTYSFLQNFIGVVDMLMVGRLGPAAISAVGLSRQIVIIIMVMVLAITTGATTLAAQFYGGGRRRELSTAAAQSLIMGFVTGVLLGLLGFFVTPSMLSWMGARVEVLQHGIPYMRILFSGMIFMVTGFVIRALLLGAGDTLTPLKIALLANLINVVANYLLIFGVGPFPRLGVAGAACGTLIARIVSTAIGMLVLLSGRFRVHLMLSDLGVLSSSMMRRVLHIGVPAGMQGLFRNGARVLLYRIIAETAGGTHAIAAASIGFQVRMISVMPALAIRVAAVSLVGRRIGAGKVEEAEEIGWQASKTCLILMSGLGLLIFVLPGVIMWAFTDSQQTLSIGYLMLRFFAIDQLFSALSIVVGGTLVGAGDTKPPLLYTIIGQWLIMLPLSYYLALRFNWDILGLCIAFTIGSIVQFVLTVARVKGGKWKSMKV